MKPKKCDRCGTAFTPGSNRARWCGAECRRAAGSEYEERRVAHQYAGATYSRPGDAPGFVSPEDVFTSDGEERRSIEEALGDAGFSIVEIPRGRYLVERRLWLDLRAAERRELAPGKTCLRCPLLAHLADVSPDVIARGVARWEARAASGF